MYETRFQNILVELIIIRSQLENDPPLRYQYP